MKSLSTIIWLTMTPARLTIASSAINPSGEPVTHSPSKAPMSPSGTVSMTTTALMTDLNWRTMVMQMSARDISITSVISARFLRNSSSSPANRIW